MSPEYVTLSEHFDNDTFWHGAVQITKAAFDGARTILYKLHSEETPIKFTLTDEEMTVLIISYISYQTSFAYPTDHPQYQQFLQAFTAYVHAAERATVEQPVQPPVNNDFDPDGEIDPDEHPF